MGQALVFNFRGRHGRQPGLTANPVELKLSGTGFDDTFFNNPGPFSVTSTFIIDSGAKTPNRPGWSAPILAGNRTFADDLVGVFGPGVEPETRRGGKRHHRGADASLSINSINRAGVQSNIGLTPGCCACPPIPSVSPDRPADRNGCACRSASWPARARRRRCRQHRRGSGRAERRPGTGGGTNVPERNPDNVEQHRSPP